MSSNSTDTATSTRATCVYCGETILRNGEGIWFSRGTNRVGGFIRPTSKCGRSLYGTHSPTVDEELSARAALDLTRSALDAARQEIADLKAERNKLERDIRDLVYERAELLKARDAANAKLRRVAMVKVWKNEDGKRFVFADDLYNAVEGDAR